MIEWSGSEVEVIMGGAMMAWVPESRQPVGSLSRAADWCNNLQVGLCAARAMGAIHPKRPQLGSRRGERGAKWGAASPAMPPSGERRSTTIRRLRTVPSSLSNWWCRVGGLLRRHNQGLVDRECANRTGDATEPTVDEVQDFCDLQHEQWDGLGTVSGLDFLEDLVSFDQSLSVRRHRSSS